MKAKLSLLLALALAAMALPARAQQKKTAPKIMAFSVQGTSVNLDLYKGKKNVVIVFYRTHG